MEEKWRMFRKLSGMNLSTYKHLILAAAFYGVLFTAVSLFVFGESNESGSLKNIFTTGYLFPVLTYSLGTVWVCIGLNLLMQKVFNKYASLVLSIAGVPPGLLMVENFFVLAFQ